MPHPYILLDRDGTLIVEKNYLASVDQVELLPGAVEGLRLLREAGFGLIVITNQSGIARGKLTLDTLTEIHREIQSRLERQGAYLEGFYYCPHGPAEGCACRKPKTLLAQRAAADFGFDLRDCFMIGDKPADISWARTAEQVRSWSERDTGGDRGRRYSRRFRRRRPPGRGPVLDSRYAARFSEWLYEFSDAVVLKMPNRVFTSLEEWD